MMEQKERLYSLDILKFIGALSIALLHLDQVIGVSFKFDKIIFEQIGLSSIVDMFFIISGFLSLYNNKKTSFDEYIKHKIKKLYPLAVISVIVSLLLMIIYKLKYGEDWFGISLGLWRIFNSIFITTKGQASRIDFGINNPLWYVSVLMVCYVAFWFATKDENKDNKYILIALCLFGLGIHEYHIDLPFMGPYIGRGFTGFFLGTIMCYLYTKYIDIVNKKWFILIPITILLVILICLAIDYSYFLDNKWCVDAVIIMPLIIIIFLSFNRYVENKKTLSVLSDISYNIYIWHCPILIIYSILSIGTCNLVGTIIFLIIVILWSTIANVLYRKYIYIYIAISKK